ncbi:hypothetical protein Cgig2_015419 [Carnegiea gigantea]|uniref:Uncharacterized protein n=1 Tax=Carnegiea gigantea TaxID=171969 RepID=A0A9Q1GLG7_9CARY|nr:hypothetical protein Cgig2_015419 [Carnegiea gigantea]
MGLPGIKHRRKFGGSSFYSVVCHSRIIGEALKQVQEEVIRRVYEKTKAMERQSELIQGFEYEPTPGYTPLSASLRPTSSKGCKRLARRRSQENYQSQKGHAQNSKQRRSLPFCHDSLRIQRPGSRMIRKLSQVMAARELKTLVGPTITFGPEDLQTPHNDALVIQHKIAIVMVRRILADIVSSVDIITLECLKKLQYSEKDLETTKTLVVGFGTNYISTWIQKISCSGGR